ncbi:MAG: anti-sigma factor family protein [Gammaproteobacteria bacterium]
MHSVVKDNLESYLDGSALPSIRRGMEAHLNTCSSCRKEMEEARMTNEWMRALVTELVMPAPGFYARVRARIQSEGSQIWPFWQLVPAFSRQMGFAVAMMLILLSSYFFAVQITHPSRSPESDFARLDRVIHREAPAMTADTHANRERAMQAIVAPLSRAEGD